jgi:hypothetical protein
LPSKIDVTRADLTARANEAITVRWEEAKARASEAEREAAEAEKATATKATADGGDTATQAAAVEVNVEQRIADAVAAVAKVEAADVTDDDVLNAMMETDTGLKDIIITSMALQQIGTSSWIHDERFASDLVPAS